MSNYNWDCSYEEGPEEAEYYEIKNEDNCKKYRCGGWANRNGPCGALDCEDCHPGRDDEGEE